MFLIGKAINKYNLPFLSFLKAFVFFPFKALTTSGKSFNVKKGLSLKIGTSNGLEIHFENNETISAKKFFI